MSLIVANTDNNDRLIGKKCILTLGVSDFLNYCIKVTHSPTFSIETVHKDDNFTHKFKKSCSWYSDEL